MSNTARSRRAVLRRSPVPRDTRLLAVVTASIDLAFAFYDTDIAHNGRLTDYVAACVVEDLQDKYHLSLIGEEPVDSMTNRSREDERTQQPAWPLALGTAGGQVVAHQ